MPILFVLLALSLSACTASMQQEKYNAWYRSLTPEQQAMEDQRRHERSLAAMQALGMINHGQGILGQGYTPPPQRSYDMTVPTYNPPRVYVPKPRQSVTCISRTSPFGGQVYTECN